MKLSVIPKLSLMNPSGPKKNWLRAFMTRGVSLTAASSLPVAYSGSTFLTAALAVVVVLVLLGLALVSSALEGIFSAAVCIYATTGSAGQFFREYLMRYTLKEKASSW